MRIKINDKQVVEGVFEVEIVCGPNCMHIQENDHQNFEVQSISSYCDVCEGFWNEDCEHTRILEEDCND